MPIANAWSTCWTITSAAGKSSGSRRSSAVSAVGPPADAPIATSGGNAPCGAGAAAAGAASGMAQWLDGYSPLPVRIARQGSVPQAGEVLLAATNDHLHLTSRGVLAYTRRPEETPYRPSVDVFFHSVVDHWKGEAIGVLLTGMGRDGALGLKAMRTKGHYTIAQDEATSAVYGMPKAAAAIGAASAVLPLERIADQLISLVQRNRQRWR